MDMRRSALRAIRTLLDHPGLADRDKLHRVLRTAARYRSVLIANTLVRRGGRRVRSGPFAGMEMPERSAEGCYVPKLLGCYEEEIHPVIERIASRGYGQVVNIGCAEGYYAVGLARLLPGSRIWAFDIEEHARTACRDMAERNGVADRVTIEGEFRHADFDRYRAGDTVVICDIEGGELSLLDPETAPAVRGFDILVELHNAFEAPFNREFVSRFEPTHEIAYIRPGKRDIDAYAELRNLEHLDQLLAFWEFRSGPTPWLFMTVKAAPLA